MTWFRDTRYGSRTSSHAQLTYMMWWQSARVTQRRECRVPAGRDHRVRLPLPLPHGEDLPVPREPGGVLSPRVSYERLCRAKALVGRAVGVPARRRPPGDPRPRVRPDRASTSTPAPCHDRRGSRRAARTRRGTRLSCWDRGCAGRVASQTVGGVACEVSVGHDGTTHPHSRSTCATMPGQVPAAGRR